MIGTGLWKSLNARLRNIDFIWEHKKFWYEENDPSRAFIFWKMNLATEYKMIEEERDWRQGGWFNTGRPRPEILKEDQRKGFGGNCWKSLLWRSLDHQVYSALEIQFSRKSLNLMNRLHGVRSSLREDRTRYVHFGCSCLLKKKKDKRFQLFHQ